jgi:hypothetical protein
MEEAGWGWVGENRWEAIIIEERRNNPGSIAEFDNALQPLIFRYH